MKRSIHTDPATAAHNAVNKALKAGTLERQPCEVCGCSPDARWNSRTRSLIVHAHHDDYSRPLDIRWLCKSHHTDYHRSIGTYAPKMVRAGAT